jgi:hypothetical protein
MNIHGIVPLLVAVTVFVSFPVNEVAAGSDTLTEDSSSFKVWNDTTQKDSAEVHLPDSTEPVSAGADGEQREVRNPFIAGIGGLIVPSFGQIYNRQFVKAGLFLASGVSMGWFAYYYYDMSLEQKKYQDAWRDSIALYGNQIDTVVVDTSNEGDTRRYMIEQQLRYRLYQRLDYNSRLLRLTKSWNSLGWLLGLYVFGVVDGMEYTGYFHDTNPRTPVVAGALSAIPALGLGQIYNGRPGKAGMIFMGQVGLGVMAWNYHQLMLQCEREFNRVANPENMWNYVFRNEFSDEWVSRRNSMFRFRNTYLWYSIFFYLYGIFDAVVDAHLHDYTEQMRLEPDIDVVEDRVGIRMNVNIKGKN